MVKKNKCTPVIIYNGNYINYGWAKRQYSRASELRYMHLCTHS